MHLEGRELVMVKGVNKVDAEPMRTSLSEFTTKAALVKSSSRYEVYDLSLKQLVISMTVLHEGKSTIGHSHTDSEEIYLLTEGKGQIQLGEGRKEDVVGGDIVTIPRGVFHRVFNKGKGDLTLVCFFEKYHGRGK